MAAVCAYVACLESVPLAAAVLPDLDDLPFKLDKLMGLITACDVTKVMGIAGDIQLTGDVNASSVLDVVIENPRVLDAICSKATCVPAVVEAIDWSKLPPTLATPEVQHALELFAPKLCEKSEPLGNWCVIELAEMVREDKANAGACNDGCYRKIGVEALTAAEPVMGAVGLGDGLGVLEELKGACVSAGGGEESGDATNPPTAKPTAHSTNPGDDHSPKPGFLPESYASIRSACGDNERLVRGIELMSSSKDVIKDIFTDDFSIENMCSAPSPNTCIGSVFDAINLNAVPLAYVSGNDAVEKGFSALQSKLCVVSNTTRCASELVHFAASSSSTQLCRSGCFRTDWWK